MERYFPARIGAHANIRAVPEKKGGQPHVQHRLRALKKSIEVLKLVTSTPCSKTLDRNNTSVLDLKVVDPCAYYLI